MRVVLRWTLLCLWALAVALGVVEVGVRLLAPQPLESTVPAILDADLIFRLPPHARGTDVKAEFAVRIDTNAQGLRDRDYPGEKPPGVLRRVLVLGDSMTFAEGVEAEEAFPKVLERGLGRTAAGRFEVVNAAVRGYGTDQELILFERLIPVYHPDEALLAFFTANDFEDNLNGSLFGLENGRLVRQPVSDATSAKYRSYHRQARLHARLQSLPGYRLVMEHSHLANFVRLRWSNLESRRIFRTSAPDPAREEEGWRLTRALLVLWAETARRHRIEPRLAIIPAWEQVVGGGDRRLDARSSRVAALARELRVPLADSTAALRVAARAAGPLYYPTDRHMTAAGHRVVAGLLQACLWSHGRPAAVPEGCVLPKGWRSLAFLDFAGGIWENRAHP